MKYLNYSLNTIVFALFMSMITACGDSDSEQQSLQEIPQYPGATRGESMEHSSFGGFIGGKLEQFSTSDSFDDVLSFYEKALSEQQPQVLSHTSELGRQTALSLHQNNGILTVTIQEFTEEGQVNITFMSVRN